MDIRFAGTVAVAVFAVGCAGPELISKTELSVTRQALATKPRSIDLNNDHLVGVATVSIRDAEAVGGLLDRKGIPYGKFNDLNSCGFVVSEADSARAQRLIREDSWKHGYELMKHMNPVPKSDRITIYGPLDGIYSGITVASKDGMAVFDCIRSVMGPDTVMTGFEGNSRTVVFGPKSGANVLAAIREDARKNGYEYFVIFKDEPELNLNIKTSPRSGDRPIVKYQPENMLTQPVMQQNHKMVTVVTVESSDSKRVLMSLRAGGISAPGVWESEGIAGIVVADADSAKALKIIQEDARIQKYPLLSTTKGDGQGEVSRGWPGPPPSKDDLLAEANLILFVKESELNFVTGCLEANGISSGASCERSACGIYVSRFDADRALALVQEDARIRGYTYVTERIHYLR